ncbi:metal ABC transporter substrate-binding protein [Corynebacterium felinum]|uniref:Zinc/manganese transport system substrate-binding protein n=1 Tax=Corynebacterium felinum TaxID=131318 RepID=A0ABU2B889_9CORY|nr:metal ABC transporter substrate-binding protein [Corynebacterium felinum]MDF5821480.1 metal ABC transporter substrate-binding protein [Corynebacterium felinum]MDR7353998.1 zinc/manganese transport system substrate-binding protein [Corynebacterium felinum]WJY96172.1 Periplasmic zinc-binding protein TroA precursor [Corynebacterium felinum]
MKRFNPRAALGAAVAATALLISGCSSANTNTETTTEAAASGNTVHAVATTTQICDYLTHIAAAGLTLEKTDSQGQKTTSGEGDVTLDLTCLLAPNASAHEHEMTPQQMKALGNADLFFVNGVDLEHFLDDAVKASGFKGTMAVTTGVGPSEGDGFTVDLGETTVDVRPWPFAEEGEEAEFTHDPHVWTDPKRASVQVSNIGAVLAKVAPESADTFKKATDAYMKQLDDLDKWVRESINSIPEENRTLFTSHDAFGYFSESYGIKFIGAALSDFNHQQDATAEHIAKAAEQVKTSGAKALFAENSNNDKSIQAIARAAGVKAILDDEALYGDSLGPVGSAGETYIGSIIHNVTTLVKAWDGTVAPLPDSISGSLN